MLLKILLSFKLCFLLSYNSLLLDIQCMYVCPLEVFVHEIPGIIICQFHHNSRTRRYVTSTDRDSTTTISSISSTSSSSTATSTGNSGANSTDIGPDSPSSGNTSNPLVELSGEEALFCSLFQLSPKEVPLAWWRSGRRCSLLDRSRPLSLTKSGKLFLTHR